MTPRPLLLCCLALCAGAGCITGEEDYIAAARAHLAKGPVSACCTSQSVPSSQCVADAITRCVFVERATVSPVKVERFGHDDGTMVEVVVEGPNGRGRCTVQVLNWPRGSLRIDGSVCSRE